MYSANMIDVSSRRNHNRTVLATSGMVFHRCVPPFSRSMQGGGRDQGPRACVEGVGGEVGHDKL